MAPRVAPGYEEVARTFAENFSDRRELGAAFAAVVDGQLVLDICGGKARSRPDTPWTAGTLQMIFSGTKGLAACCILKLMEQRRLGLATPVAHYWPGFEVAGKSEIRVFDVLTHQAGLPAITRQLEPAELCDGQHMADLLASAKPFWPGERRIAYHALTYGWLCAELVRRTTGQTIGRFFNHEIARPLGLEIWIGLPDREQPRVAELSLHPTFLTPPPTDPRGHQVYGNPPIFSAPLIWNRRDFQAAEIPGINAIGSARSIARLYGCLALGGTIDGTAILRPETIDQARTLHAHGHDAVFGDPMAYGLGFQLQDDLQIFGPPPSGFGHAGAGGSIHGAWPELATGFSYAMNELRDKSADDRGKTLLEALYRAVASNRAIRG